MQAELTKLLNTILMKPGSDTEFFIAGVAALITFVIVLNKVGSSFGLIMAQTGRTLVVLAIGLVLNALVLGFLSSVYSPQTWMLVLASAVLLLIVVTPCACWLQKGSYSGALFALIISGAAALVIIAFVHTAFGAMSGGGKSVGKGLMHNRETERMLNE
ncbi:MAG: hypothetical protein O3A51_05690 [Verrucomicrobia bacterium]|nr:hypothetical protein [Verrucomicrobiota bacterium]